MLERIHEEWSRSLDKLIASPFFEALGQGKLGISHYKVWLRETYYNTRENPPSFALMAGYLKDRHRSIIPRILRHSAAEFGHHELALADLKTLGENVENIPSRRPLPTTEALIAFAVYNIQHGNPLTYLGYVYHLEMLPAQLGPRIIGNLQAMGVPKEAMTFLEEHAHADIGHTKLMEENFRSVIKTEEDLEAVLHGALGTSRLHGMMLQGVLEEAEAGVDWAPGAERPKPKGSATITRPGQVTGSGAAIT